MGTDKNAKILFATAGALLVVSLLWSTPASQAKHAVGALRLKKPAELLSTPPDPQRFAADLQLVMPRPVVPLTLADVVAQEVLTRAHSLSQADALRTAQVLCDEAKAAGYDPLLLLALIRVESAFDEYALSPVGAEGLMQLMPETGKWVAGNTGLERRDNTNFDPVLNVRLGTRYLAQLEQQFGSIELALTAYNRGPTNTRLLLRRFGRIPDSVRDVYASKVLRHYRTLRDAYGSLPLG